MTIESVTKKHQSIMVGTLKLADIINPRPFISSPEIVTLPPRFTLYP